MLAVIELRKLFYTVVGAHVTYRINIIINCVKKIHTKYIKIKRKT